MEPGTEAGRRHVLTHVDRVTAARDVLAIESEAHATAPAGRPERWVQTQWGPSEDHLHYLSHVSKWGPGLQDYGDGCRATITVENNDIDGGQFVRVIVHSIAQARATAPAGLREALQIIDSIEVDTMMDSASDVLDRCHNALVAALAADSEHER